MKKFMLLILALLIAGLAFADTVQIGTGTTNSSYFPIYGLYGYNYSQQIYTQAEINTTGTISKIRFYYVSGTITNNKDWVIYMGHTTKTVFNSTTDWEPLANLTQVFAGNVTSMVPLANNWMEITLTTPFVYNNTSNLIIAVDENTAGYASMSWGAFASGANRGISYYSDGTNPDPATPPTANYGPNATINRIQLVFPSTSAPLAPTLVSPSDEATGVALNALLTWSATAGGGDATSYDVYMDTVDGSTLVSENQVEASYSVTLAYGTTYYWKVVASNAIGDSPASDVWSFTAMDDPTEPLPYLQDFEIPTTLAQINWTGTFSIMTNHGTSGSKGLSRNLYSSATTAVATTPPIGPMITNAQLKFDYRFVNWSSYPANATPLGAGDNLQIQVSTDAGASYTTVYTIDQSNHVTSTSFANVSVSLAAYTTGSIMIRFLGTWGSGDYYLDIDNVIVQEAPAGAPNPVTLNNPANEATGLPQNGFNLTWTPAQTGGTPTYYGVFMSQDEATIYEDVYFETTATLLNPTTYAGGPSSPITFNYEDRWYWTVQAINDDGDALVEPAYWFDIEADPTIVVGPDTPWTEGFEGATFPPLGWTMNDTDSDGQNWFLYNFEGTAHTGTNSAASASWTSTTGALNPDNWLITPPVAIPATGEYLIEYYVGAQDPDYPQDHYGLYISTTGTAPADFSLLFEETFMDGAWYYRSQNLASYAGQTVHFAFRHFDSYDWFYMKIDDVTVRELPETPALAISPTAWDFGSVQLLNPTTPKSFALSNVGAGTIDILAGDIQLTGDAEGNFVLVANNLPASLSGSNTYTFTVQFIPQSLGTKTATINVQDNLTRVLHTIELSGECVEEPIASVITLQGTVEAQVNVRLNWASIYGDPTQAGYVHWDDSIQRGNVGAGATPFHAVAKYGTEVTALAAGKVLDGVMIHIAEEPQLITSVKVWTGTDADLAPLTMVHEETVSDLTVGWNYVALTTPVPITGTDAIYVGYYSTGMLDVFPASTDGLTAVDGRGNVLEISGSWNTLTASSITGSWLIHAHFEEAGPIMAGRRPVVLQNVAVNNVEMTDEALRNSPVKARMNGNVDRVLRGFNVYRDGVQINSEIVAAYTYLDEGLAADTYDYAAQAVHYSANGPISGTIPVTVDPPADPIALPFLEDWASADYDANMWSVGSSNWVMNTTTGNPAPSASFSWSPQITDYTTYLTSFNFDGTGHTNVMLSYELALNNFSTDAENNFAVEVWNGTSWNQIADYSSFDNDGEGWGFTYSAHDISAYAAGNEFKIRFVAYGEDSYEINDWYLDNINIYEIPATLGTPELSISNDETNVILNWTAVPGATWYGIYSAADPYGTYSYIGYLPSTYIGVSLPLGDMEFFQVRAGAGTLPRGRMLDNGIRR